jgi:ubiquinone/menaquinone biosynthesis C-methylase UbiE
MISDKTIKAYSDPTWLYDIRGFFILTFAYRDTLQRQVAFFSRNMRQRHGEFAIGSGTLFSIILHWRKLKRLPLPETILISDYVPSMLASAQHRFRKNTHIKSEVADLTNLHQADNCFESINIANSLHCIAQIEPALKEVYRVLVPGGTFASNTLLYPQTKSFLDRISIRINNWGIKKGILHTPYTESDLVEKITNAGFLILETARHGNAFYILAKRPEF